MQQTADNTEFTKEGVLLESGYRLDQYEIESVLAVGDFRITYYAWDHRKDRNVVIHEYYPRSLSVRGDDRVSVTSQTKDRFTDFEFGLSEFLLEARLVSQIRSPYLPNVIEYREANGTGYLVTEYDDGRTLRETLDRDVGQFSEKQLNEILSAALQGLRELHARNLLHTSVSPTNLFIRFRGHPILLGQGLARYRLAQYTKTYAISLAQGYTPLEQYGLDGNIGPWSDLYALGASLYECIAGVRPVDASTRHTSLIKGELDPLTPAVEIGHGSYSNLLLSNIDWMLKPYLEDRPDSADLMLGVVSFQKQSQKKKEFKPSAASDEIAARDSQVDSTEQVAVESTVDEEQAQTVQPELIQTEIRDRGRYVYWSLGLLLLVFLAVTGYQIYKYEISPQPEVDTADLQTETLFDAEVITPQPVEQSQQQAEETAQAAEDRTISRGSDEQRRDFYEGLYREEEVQQRVEEELKALQVKQQIEELKQETARKKEIETLLEKAQQAVGESKLLHPEGENAYEIYSEVLALEPDNKLAESGLNEIADNYFNRAIVAIEKNDPELASEHLNNLIRVRPDDPRLSGFLQQITDLKAKLKIEQAKQELNEQLESEQKVLQEQQEVLAQREKELVQGKAEQVQVTAEAPKTEQAAQSTEVEEVKTESTADPDSAVDTDENIVADTSQLVPEPDKDEDQTKTTLNRSELSQAYQNYDRGDYSPKLFDTMLQAANLNEGRAQYILAEMYAAGRGVDQNFAESTFWLKRSLDYVNQNAKYRQAWAEKAMGVIYEKGWYVDSDLERAVRWYRSSADKGYPPAQYRLGLAYAKGLGVVKDNEQAEFWFKKALSNGNQEAKKALSKLSTRN